MLLIVHKGSLHETIIKELLESHVGAWEHIFLTHALGSLHSETGLEPRDVPPKWVTWS